MVQQMAVKKEKKKIELMVVQWVGMLVASMA